MLHTASLESNSQIYARTPSKKKSTPVPCPRVWIGTRRLATITAAALLTHTPLYPPAPADMHDGAALARVAVLRVTLAHRTRTKALAGKSNKKGIVQMGALSGAKVLPAEL